MYIIAFNELFIASSFFITLLSEAETTTYNIRTVKLSPTRMVTAQNYWHPSKKLFYCFIYLQQELHLVVVGPEQNLITLSTGKENLP